MVKAFAPSALALGFLLGGGLLAVACSSSSDSEFAPEPPKPDATDDGPISNLVPDGGGAPDTAPEAGPTSCPPGVPTNFAPAWDPATKQKKSACSAEDMKGYWDACLVDPSKTELDGTCSKWKAAHMDCAACTEPADKTGPIQWHVERKFYTLNVATCIAITQNEPEVGKCGDTYNAAVQCARESCEACFGIGGTFDQFRDCQKSAAATDCKTYETTRQTACQGFNATPATQCLNDGKETPEVHFTRVIGLLCGM